MVICKYFLEGRCYYGHNCRFEHTYDGGDRTGTRPNSATYYAPQQQQTQQPTTRNANEYRQVMVEEIRNLEGGHQWPFSCLSPLKDERLVPGMDDISPDELRFEAYEAIKQNTFDSYKLRVEGLKQEYQRKRNQLLNLDTNSFQEMFLKNTPATTTSSFSQPSTNQTTNVFGSTSATSFQSGSDVFGGGSTSATTPSTSFSFALGGSAGQQQSSGQSIFGGSSTFGQPSSTFGQQPTSVFGGNNAATPSVSSIFGQASGQTSTFGAPSSAPPPYTSPQASVFGQTTNTFGQSQAPSTLFGQTAAAQPSSTSNIFGQTAAATQSSTPTNIFAQTAAATTSNLFGQQPSTQSVFGSNQPFGASTTQNPVTFGNTAFGTSANNQFGQSAVFGDQSTLPQQTNTQTPIFGSTFSPSASTPSFAQPSANVFGQTSSDSNAFSQTTPTPAAPTSNVFGQSSNVFSQASPSSNVFGQTTPTNNVFTQPSSTSSNVFSTPPNVFDQTSAAANVFSQTAATQPNVFSQAGSTSFTQSATAINPFTQQATVAAVIQLLHYTKLEDLSEEEKSAFESPEFVLGKIPTKAPARELCV